MDPTHKIRPVITALCGLAFLFISHGMFGQPIDRDKVPQPPTSATDADVKVHGGKLFNRNRNLAKKLGGQAGSTERQGKKFKKQKKAGGLGREARVFKNHNHFARKEKASTGKKSRIKKP